MEKSLLRRLLTLAIVVLLAHAGWKIAPVFVHHFELKDRITEAARFSAGRSAVELKQQVLALAAEVRVPLDARALTVQKSGDHIRVDATYTQNLEVLPRYYYPYTFTIVVDTRLARPSTPDEIR